jgi:hypothetical protein
MTSTAIGREAADIAADKAHCSLPASSTDPGRLVGLGMSKSDFAHKERRRMIAQAQARGMLYREFTIRADFIRLDL